MGSDLSHNGREGRSFGQSDRYVQCGSSCGIRHSHEGRVLDVARVR